MSGLRLPGLGPIVGHTTDDSCRIWIRGHTPRDEGAQLASALRTVGILGLVDPRGRLVAGADGAPVAYYFRLQREFDRTGAFLLGADVALGRHAMDGLPPAEQSRPCKLAPDTEYRVRAATLTLDDPMADADSMSDAMLAQRLPDIGVMARMLEQLDPGLCEARFRTFPAPGAVADALDFLIGSCRYSGLGMTKQADRIFAAMADHLRRQGRRPPARFTMLMGDQIYADTLSRFVPIGRADTFAEFQERYHEAFGAPNMRRFLSNAPVYMILDDHEIEDNWSQDRLREKHELFNLAIGAYLSYQWSHGPRSFGRRLYYHFDCGGYPFFVLDARTQRNQGDRLEDNHLLGRPTIDPLHPSQLDVFLAWLEKQQKDHGNAPKFVVCASVFAPNRIDERVDPTLLDRIQPGSLESPLFEANRQRRARSDSWPAFPQTRRAILRRILEKNIQNVIFLTGDVHCANIARLFVETEQGDSGLFAYDVTSSALYWPFPFADGDPNDFVHDSRHSDQSDAFPLPESQAQMHYRAWGFTQEDNFCRIEVDKNNHLLRVRAFDRDGEPITVSNADGQPTQVNELPLAAWK